MMRRVPCGMRRSPRPPMLRNGSFETPWEDGGTNRVLIFHTDGRVESTARDNTFSPPGWTVWYKHGLPIEHDPANQVGWAQPETRLLPPQPVGPRRVLDGDWAFLLFTFFRIHDAGLFQVVDVEPGREYRLVAHAHAWSNHDAGPHPDDPDWSEGAGRGPFDRPASAPDVPVEAKNFTFQIGLDPTGGLNPYASSVAWSPPRHVYNEYGRFEVEAEAVGPKMTVFLRSRAQWPYKHNDAYWDAVSLNPVDESITIQVTPANPSARSSVELVLSAPAPLTNVELALAGPSGEPVSVRMQFVRRVGGSWFWGFVSAPLPSPGEYVATASADGEWAGSVGFRATGAGPEPPGPAWPYPVIATGAKLGVHAIQVANTLEYLAQGFRPPVFKVVDWLETLHAVKEIAPDALTVARRVSPAESCPGVADPAVDLRALRDALFAPVLESLDADPDLANAVDYWEICNEPDPPGPDGYRRLAELMALCIDRADELGLRLALFALNAGTPEWPEMEALADSGVFGHARRGGHVLSVHEGVFSPDQPIDLWFLDDIPGCPPGLGRRIRAGALCFRYRFLAHLLEERGELVPVIVSEWYPGSPDPSEDNLARVAWYDGEMAADYYALGFCPFTLGPTPPWKDLAELYEDRLLAYAAAATGRPNALPPSPPAPEQPCRGAPRVQYARTYVLLPPDLDEALARLVFNAAWRDYRATVGGSADDAGIGDLDSRTVIAVNPDGWPGDLRAFFEEYYPGVELHTVDLGDGPNSYQVRGRIAAAQLARRLNRPLHTPTTHTPLVVTDPFGVWRGTYHHNGLDLRGSLSLWGDRALAAWEGEVIAAGENSAEPWFGVQVRTRTMLPDGTELLLRYAHLAETGLSVAVGDYVSPGDVLGGVDNTGRSSGDHLHFDVKWRGIPVDPAP
ncbi:MAG TPA: M23 family metallopeptidase, partial [Planctomycetaceae bacterium]|nr:M23 family metallopeptidase [Planctomycetaceae bacterium]